MFSKSKFYIGVIIFLEISYLFCGLILLKFNNSFLFNPYFLSIALFLGIASILTIILISPDIFIIFNSNKFQKKPKNAEFTLQYLYQKKYQIQLSEPYIVGNPAYVCFISANDNPHTSNNQIIELAGDVYIKISEKGIHFQPKIENKTYFIPKETIKKVNLYPWDNGSSEDYKLLWVSSMLIWGKVIFAAKIPIRTNKAPSTTLFSFKDLQWFIPLTKQVVYNFYLL